MLPCSDNAPAHPLAQVFDEDKYGDDDFLGRAEVHLGHVVDEGIKAAQVGHTGPGADFDYILPLTCEAGHGHKGVVSITCAPLRPNPAILHHLHRRRALFAK